MLLIPACVAVQIIGAPPAPAEVGALESRCSGILGGDRCRVVVEAAPRARDSAGEDACWRATVTIAERGAAAQVVLRTAHGVEARDARRDIAFQDRDEVSERWATLGLLIAALVTVEERSAATATAADAATREPAPAPPPSPSPAAPSPIMATSIAVPALDVPVRTRAGPGVHVTLAGAAVTGPLPGTAFGARVEAGVDWARAGAVARLAYYPEHNRATVPVAAGIGGGDFRLWVVSAGGCARGRATRSLAMRACAGGTVASTAATGFGVGDAQTASARTTMLWAGLGLQAQVSRRIALIAEPELTLALQRPPFAIRGAGTVFTPSRVGGGVALGVAVDF